MPPPGLSAEAAAAIASRYCASCGLRSYETIWPNENATASASAATRTRSPGNSKIPKAVSMKNGTKHDSAQRSTNTGAIVYDAASIISGGAHIQSSAKAIESRAPRRHPDIAPQIASAARIGNAKLPVALLKNAKGSNQAGGLRHPPRLPAE